MSTEYIKTSWQDGDIITADKMNNIENGIKDVEGTTGELKENLTQVEDTLTGGTVLTPTSKTLADDFTKVNYYIQHQNGLVYTGTNRCYLAPLGECKKVTLTGNASYGTQVAFLSSNEFTEGAASPIVGGTLPTVLTLSQAYEANVPTGATYFYIRRLDDNGRNVEPSNILFYYEVASGGLVSDVTALETKMSAMDTASASDVGKALLVQTVSGGKVTAWEFGEAGSSVEIDDTLTQSGEAADAKATGDAINEVQTVLDGTTATADAVATGIGYTYDEQYILTVNKTTGYYYSLSGGAITTVANEYYQIWKKIPMKAGTYFQKYLSTAYTYIQKQSDLTDIVTLSSLTANTDGSYTIAYDFYLYPSESTTNGVDPYWATTTLSAPYVEGRYNESNDITALIEGNTTTYTGSWYQLREGDFKAGTTWRIKLTAYAQTTGLTVTALTDASNTSTAEDQFVIYTGQEVLWSPLKDYEAIRYGANGSCTLTINDCTALSDQMERKVFYCGASRKYTKLIDAIAAAEMYMGSILYVDAGTYDLVSEFGADYFAGITSSNSMPGIVLKNRIHIIFSPNSFVTCHYTGDNEYVLINFAPFNCGQYGFTLENLNLSASRTRYAIHDERNGKTEQCLSRYLNCNIKQDNSNNASWGSYCCIGGGLGANHEVDIENCTFESVARTGTVVHGAVSYHPSNNSGSTDFACQLVVKDNYFKTGTIEISGIRTDAVADTTVIVTNNSFEYNSANSESGIYYSGSQSYQGTHYNIRAWNNEIRNAS